MHYDYKPRGVCSQKIEFDIEEGILKNVKYVGGCNGNLKGIGSLVEGMKVEEVIDSLEGIKCGIKQSSCPDQLARALREISNSK